MRGDVPPRRPLDRRPGTLVGQVDAAIGGKTAINVAAKNDVGAFWQPESVICDPELLETLPPREWTAGFAEALKTGLLAGGPLLELVRSWPPGPGTPAQRAELVRRCAGFKAVVVAEDPTEQGRRAILNLGHTIGHGIEAVAGYGVLLHGEAVGDCVVAALWISEQLRGLSSALREEMTALLTAHGLPVRADGEEAGAVLEAMRHARSAPPARTASSCSTGPAGRCTAARCPTRWSQRSRAGHVNRARMGSAPRTCLIQPSGSPS